MNRPPHVQPAALTASIHANLYNSGSHNMLVTDGQGVALAACIPGMVEENHLTELSDRVTAVGRDANGGYEVRTTAFSPYIGRLAVGRRSGVHFDMLEPVADVVVQAGMNSPHYAAERLAVSDSGHLLGDAAFHINNPADGYLKQTDRHWLGIVLHLSLRGQRLVEFGLVRDPEAYESAQQHIAGATAKSTYSPLRLARELEVIYRGHCDSFASITQYPGDLLIFQGAAYSPQRLPVAHRFSRLEGATAPATAITTPWANPERSMVLDARRAVTEAARSSDSPARGGSTTAHHDRGTPARRLHPGA